MNHKFNRQLIVFTRFPVAGVTKTRLIPSLGADGAALLQRKMTEHTLKRISGTRLDPAPVIEIRFTGGDEKQMRAWLGDTYRYHPQTGGDLGSRMASAFESAFDRQIDQAVLIGTDIPAIRPATIEAAFNSLGPADGVLGPAGDGGYYLIGFSRDAFPAGRRLFEGLDWGTGHVLADTLKIAAKLDLVFRQLEALADVDNPADLVVWEQEAGNS